MKTICLVVPSTGSVITFRKELIFTLQENYNVAVIACDNQFEKEIIDLGVDFYFVGGSNKDTGLMSNLRYKKNLTTLFKAIKPYKVFTFQAKLNIFAVIAAYKSRCKYIYSMVEGLGRGFNNTTFKEKILRKLMIFLYRKSFKKVSKVFFLNDGDKKTMIDKKIINDNRCVVLNGIGVDIDYFKREKQSNDSIIRFVMVARIEREKGYKEYCQAAKMVYDAGHKNAEFNYYGGGDDVDFFQNYSEFVNYRGVTRDIKSALEMNDIIVLPTYYGEGCPRSLMEGISMGMPIITTPTDGCMSLIENDVNGYLVEKKDIAGLSKAFIRFINNLDSVYNMGKRSREIAELKFDSRIINKIICDEIAH